MTSSPLFPPCRPSAEPGKDCPALPLRPPAGFPWRLLGFLLLLLPLVPARPAASAERAGKGHRPNFVVIVIDDAGFMDLGACGGEAATPNIDRLASRGVLFTNYHTSPLCSPSRAMLLTGIDNHRAGMATIPEILPPAQRGRPGYTMHLEPGVLTVASRLKAAGYRTYLTGKWHLGEGEGDLPDSHGFDRSFALAASGADNWEQRAYIPYYDGAPWYEDGRPARLPEDFYSSRFIVDKMIEYLESGRDDERPFFAYLAFQALHVPVQAPREYTARYEDVYEKGWRRLREERWRRARELGLIPEDAPLADMQLPMFRKWEDLSPADRRLWAKSMAVNAGMLEAMDHHVGRLLDYLEKAGVLEKTVFLVTSDNGPAPTNPVAEAPFRLWLKLTGYHRDLETLGEEGSFVCIGPEWASAAASPGAYFKWQVGEGGLHVPLIVAGPGVAGARRLRALSFVSDVTPTILDLAGVDPDAGDAAVPITGRSLAPLLRGRAEAVYDAGTPVGIEVSGQAALFKGPYKLVRNNPPYGDGVWRLYDIQRDPGETRDLAEERPALFAGLMEDYEAYCRRMGVLEMPQGYDMYDQIHVNTIQRMIRFHWAIFLGVAVVLCGLLVLVGWIVVGGIRRLGRC